MNTFKTTYSLSQYYHHHLHFTVEETVAQRSQVAGSRSHSHKEKVNSLLWMERLPLGQHFKLPIGQDTNQGQEAC